MAHIKQVQAQALETLSKAVLVGCSENQKELDTRQVTGQGDRLGEKAVAVFPDCSAEVLNREQEMRARITEKVMQLTDPRIAL